MDDPRMTPQNPFASLPIEITVCVGKARARVKDLLRLGPDAVLVLDRRVEDPVELYVGGRLIARGELQEQRGEPPGTLAVRLTEVTGGQEGL